MTRKLDPILRGQIEALLPVFNSVAKVIAALKSLGKIVSRRSIYRVKEDQTLEAKGCKKPRRQFPKHMRKSACKKSNVQKVSDCTDDPNPQIEKDMAQQLNICRRSVGRILNEQLTRKRLK